MMRTGRNRGRFSSARRGENVNHCRVTARAAITAYLAALKAKP